MDEADYAQREQERELRRILAACAYAMRKMESRGESAHECEDCGNSIPEARRQAMPGCSRCVGCQKEHERKV